MSKLTTRITALLLSGMLAIGSVPGSVFAADADPGQTSEYAEEVFTEEETAEESSEAADAGAEEEAAGASEGNVAGTPEETAVQYYTVTLDANGGYFENEWDDAVGDYTQQAEVVEKYIPVGGTVSAFPVFTNQDGQSMLFAGWSLERDGELVITGDEEYAPVDNCVLYAVWQVVESEDVNSEETGEQEVAEENIEQVYAVQDSEEVEDASKKTVTAEEGTVEEDTASEANAEPETEKEKAVAPGQEAVSAIEDAEKATENSSDTAAAEEDVQPEHIESSEKEETVTEEAAYGIVKSGTCGDNLIWTLDEEGTLTISGTGEMTGYGLSDNINPWNSYMVKKVIIESGVKSIGTCAFYDNGSLISVIIPNSVTIIHDHAFEGCVSLTNVTIPSSVTTIGEYVFYGCINLSSVTIPSSVLSISPFTFYNCKNLRSISIPNSLKYIAPYLFKNCTSLTSVTIPSSVTTISTGAFYGCSSLENVTIPKSVTTIEGIAFSECSSLTSVTISKGVSNIGGRAFSRCNNLKTIYFCGNAPAISFDAFYDFYMMATSYYPANDPTWTEDVRQNYGGNITWEPWNPDTDPTDPDSFSLSVGTPTNNAVVIGEDGQLTVVAYYEFTNQNTALEEAQKIKWTCSDSTAVEIYNPGYILGTKDVHISLSLRGKKPGSYTLTGTTPDGRTASADVVVEPKIIAVSNNTTISETTDVVMVQTSLNTGNRTYLTYFLNGITGKIKDDFGTIGGADSKRIEVSEDGKTGKLIYTLTPVFGGNAEFTFTSPGGQKVIEKIYSGLDNYPWDISFIMPDDSWSFNNYVAEPIPVQTDDYNKLTNGMDMTLRKYINDQIAVAGKRGQCYGIAATSILVDQGRLSLSDIQEGIDCLNQATDSENIRSLIGLYFLNQFTDDVVRDMKTFLQMSTSAQLQKIERSSFPILFSFGCKGWGSHAVVGYAIEGGYWKIYHDPITKTISYDSTVLGTEYDTKLLVYDSNRCANSNPEGSCLYYNSNTFEWEIPNYYEDGLSSKKKGYLKQACSNIDAIAKINSSAFNYKGMVLRGKSQEGFSATISGETYNIDEEAVKDKYVCLYDEAGTDETVPVYNVYFNNNSDLTVEPNTNGPADYSLLTSEYYFDIEAQTYTSAAFDVMGKVSAAGIEGDYTLEITSNEENPSVPYYSFTVEGNDAGNISVDLQDDGLHISGDNLENVTVIGENDNTTNTFIISTNDDEVLIIGDENGLQGLIDLNNDGVFDKEEQLSTVQILKAGDCGENVSWKLYSDGTLTLSGKGAIPDYLMDMIPHAPWLFEKVKKVVIGNGITRIGNYAFFNIGTLQKAILPNSLKEIGWGAFQECQNLKTVNIPSSVEVIDGFAFYETAWMTDKRKNDPYVIINGILIDGNTVQGDEIIIPANVKKIAPFALSYNANYTSVVIPEGVELIGDGSFFLMVGNEELSTVSLPKSIRRIEANAFRGRHIDKIKYGGTPSDWEKLNISKDDNQEIYYASTISYTFVSIKKAIVSGIEDKTYSGKQISQTPTLKIGSSILKVNRDYSISFSNNTNVGTAKLVITGIGDYEGAVTKTFTITPAPLTDATVSGISNKTYTGSALTLNPTVKVGDKTLKKGTDYTITYANNTNVGTATVTITGKGNYVSKKTATFKINKAAQSITAKAGASRVAVGKTTTVSITGNEGKKSYKSSNTAIATVTSAGKVTAKKVGTVKITATSAATSNYNAASKTVTIKVVPAATASLTAANQTTGIKLTWKKVTGANGYKVYRGSTLIKTITSDSTVTYADAKANTNGTKYTYKVVAKATTGDSTLSKSRVIYRVSRPAVSSVTNSALSKMTVKWGKNAKGSGYQIQYSMDKTFKSGIKSVSITSAFTVSKVFGSLKKSKIYYVRIRTYKTVGSSKYWSEWSPVKSVKIIK